MQKRTGAPEFLLICLLAAGVGLILVAGYRSARMYFLVGEFVVLSSHTECPARNHCVQHYSVRTPDEESAIDFVPFDDEFNGGALYQGASMIKRSTGFDYTVNGVTERWPFLPKQVALFIAGIAGLIVFFALSGPRYLRWSADRGAEPERGN